MGTNKLLWEQSDKMLGGNLRWTSVPSRGNRNIPSRFILQKPEISAGLIGFRLTQLRLGTDFTFRNDKGRTTQN